MAEIAPAADRTQFTATLPRLEAALRSASAIGATDTVAIARQFEAGQSNPTYLLDAGGRHLVLRKQPYGDLLPRAHDVVRENAIMRALHGAGFTVPRPVFASEDRQIIGTSFFVMDYVPGVVHSDPALPEETPATRRALYQAMIGTMARLHRVAPAVLESAGVKPRGDFVGRQIAVWRSAYLAAQTQDDARVEHVGQWLLDHKPATENLGIVHGDYRIENLIFRGTQVAAVLDWELCTIGEPLADLAYCCIWHHLPKAVLGGLADQDLAALGIPDEQEILALYERETGIDAAATRDYFLAFAFYRLAAILQGVYRRALDGNAASPQALARGRVAELCLTQAAAFAAGSQMAV